MTTSQIFWGFLKLSSCTRHVFESSVHVNALWSKRVSQRLIYICGRGLLVVPRCPDKLHQRELSSLVRLMITIDEDEKLLDSGPRFASCHSVV